VKGGDEKCFEVQMGLKRDDEKFFSDHVITETVLITFFNHPHARFLLHSTLFLCFTQSQLHPQFTLHCNKSCKSVLEVINPEDGNCSVCQSGKP
jgi:hypothetical protein